MSCFMTQSDKIKEENKNEKKYVLANCGHHDRFPRA
jgi:hypothetical protein